MGLFNHGLHYPLISYGYHGWNKRTSGCKGGVCSGSTGKPVPQLPWTMLLVPAQPDFSDPHQRLKAMLFTFCQWSSKASTNRSRYEISPTSVQDILLGAQVQARRWVLETWQQALLSGCCLWNKEAADFPPYWSSRVVLLGDCAVRVHKGS